MTAGSNKTNKKGFSGLSDLVSEVSEIDTFATSEPKAERKHSGPEEQLPQEIPPADPVQEATNVSPSSENMSPGKSGDGSGSKVIFGILAVLGIVFVFWMFSQNKKQPAYIPSSSPQSSPAPAVPTSSPPRSTPQSAGLQYSKPPVGTNNVLSVQEIQWCIREGIRIETIRNLIESNEGIDAFNRIVKDYNSRCGSYRYRKGSQLQAERNVEPYRSQIVEEAIREAKQLSRPPQQPSPPVTSPPPVSSTPEKPVASDTPEKASAEQVTEAQQILTDLGYKPGPVDGGYGRRTADAVKAFQRDAGITQDGRIDQNLLNLLKKTKAEHKPPIASQPKLQTQTNLQPRSNISSAATPATSAKPETLSYEEQARYGAAQRLARLGYEVNWRTSSLAEMLDAESKIGTAQRLAQLGYNVNWRTSSLSEMLDAESKIGTANRLARLGYNVNWQTTSLTEMLDAESRIGTANRLKLKGISVDWRNYSLTQLLHMER